MSLHIGDVAPDFTTETTAGAIAFHEWIGNDWVFFFSHPGDFNPFARPKSDVPRNWPPNLQNVM
ncbi:hypothetical protein [Planktotalea arctica]|uniref:hypothetical protein n=1 Tax=Planktotalea arctica TaxID=1481893 RepID=UPI003D2F58DE